MKKILIIIMVLGLSLGLVACSSETTKSDFETIQENGKMVIGYTDYAPINYTNENGEFTGFDTEFAQAVCKELGIEAEFVEIEWSNKFLELESGSIDCIWNGMTITDEAKEAASVSNPYLKNMQVVVAKTENGYTSTADLIDANIVAEAGSAGEAAVLADGNLSQASLMTVIKQVDALLEVKSGASDAAILDWTLASNMVGQGTDYSDLSILEGVELSVEEYGIATRKGSDTNDKINEVMAKFMADGTLETLATSYGLKVAE